MKRETALLIAFGAIAAIALYEHKHTVTPAPLPNARPYGEFPELQTTFDLDNIPTGHYRLETRLPSGVTGGTEFYWPENSNLYASAHAFVTAYKNNGLVPLRFFRVE